MNKEDNQHVFQFRISLVSMETFMANTMSTDCFRKKLATILNQFLTSLLLFLTTNMGNNDRHFWGSNEQSKSCKDQRSLSLKHTMVKVGLLMGNKGILSNNFSKKQSSFSKGCSYEG